MSLLAQPKRLALLVFLAIEEPPGFHRRDRLLTLFWPEMDEERARAALRRALYFVRRSLDRSAVVARGDDEIGVATERLRCDVVDLREALRTGELEAAFDLYRGDLLAGFHLDDAPQFTQWLDGTRRRLRSDMLEAALALEGRYRDQGDVGEALGWARRALELAPTSERALQHVLTAHAAIGDMAAAAREMERFRDTLRTELDAEVSAATEALFEQLRSAPPASGAAAVAAEAAQPRSDQPPHQSPPHPPTADAALPSVARPASSAGGRRRGRSARRWLQAVVVAAGVAAAAPLLLPSAEDARADSSPKRLAVFPFSVQGGEHLGYLGDAMVSMLYSRLDGTGRLSLVDPYTMFSAAGDSAGSAGSVDRLLGVLDVDEYITGAVVESNDGLHVTATLFDRDGSAKASADVRVEEGEEIMGMGDELARLLIVGELEGPAARTARAAALTTESLEALKAFLRGERYFRTGAFLAAQEQFELAVAADSTFALAWYRLSLTRDWQGLRESLAALKVALRLSDQLPYRERLHVQARYAYWDGSALEAEHLYREILEAFPDDIEANLELGEVIFHRGPYRGMPSSEAAPHFRRVLALQPDHVAARLHLARIAAQAGDIEEVAAHARSLANAEAGHARRLELDALHAFGSGDPAAIADVMERLRSRAGGSSPQDPALDPVHDIAARTAAWLSSPWAGQQIAELVTSLGRSEAGRAQGHLLRGALLAGAGRWREAAGEVEVAAKFAPYHAALSWARMVAFAPPEVAERRAAAALAALRAARARHDPASDPLVQRRRGRIGIAGPYLEAWLESFEADPEPVAPANPDVAWPGADSAFREIVRAHRLARAGDAAGALEAFDRVWDPGRAHLLRRGSMNVMAERHFRATLLERLGRHEEALGWYRSIVEDVLVDPNAFGPAHLGQARTHEALGNPAVAARHYRIAADIWRHADPELQPRVRHALDRADVLEAEAAKSARRPRGLRF